MSERIQVDHPHETSRQLHQSRYQFASQYAAGQEILDIACGVGYGSQILAQAGAVRVVGVDIDPASIDQAKIHYNQANTTFLVASAEQLPLPDASFDLAISFETIEHIQHPDKFIDELYRILKPGGKLIISTPNRQLTSPITWLKPGNRFHRFEASLDQFTRMVARRFSNLSFYGQQSVTSANLAKFKKTQAYSQILRYLPEQLIEWIKTSRPGLQQRHRQYLGDLHQSLDPAILQVYSADKLPFVRYMIILAQK